MERDRRPLLLFRDGGNPLQPAPPPHPSMLWGSPTDRPPKRPAPQREGQGEMKMPLSPAYCVSGDKLRQRGQEAGPWKGIQVSGLRLGKKKTTTETQRLVGLRPLFKTLGVSGPFRTLAQ